MGDYMHDKVISRVDKGHYLCEQTLWTRWTHVGTARAHTETRIVILDAKKFADICSTFPTEHARLYAMEFVQSLNLSGQHNHGYSDMGPPLSELASMISTAFPIEEDDDCGEESEHMVGARSSQNTDGTRSVDMRLHSVFGNLWETVTHSMGVNTVRRRTSLSNSDEGREKQKMKKSLQKHIRQIRTWGSSASATTFSRRGPWFWCTYYFFRRGRRTAQETRTDQVLPAAPVVS